MYKKALFKYLKKFTRPNLQGKQMNLSLYLLEVSKTHNETHFVELKKILKYTMKLLGNLFDTQQKKEDVFLWKLATNQAFYDAIATKIEEDGIDVAAIQAIEL